jgi:hypothetical protein
MDALDVILANVQFLLHDSEPINLAEDENMGDEAYVYITEYALADVDA